MAEHVVQRLGVAAGGLRELSHVAGAGRDLIGDAQGCDHVDAPWSPEVGQGFERHATSLTVSAIP